MPTYREAYIWVVTVRTILDGKLVKYLAQIDDRGVAQVDEIDWFFEPGDYEESAEAGLKRAEAYRAAELARLRQQIDKTEALRFTVPA